MKLLYVVIRADYCRLNGFTSLLLSALSTCVSILWSTLVAMTSSESLWEGCSRETTTIMILSRRWQSHLLRESFTTTLLCSAPTPRVHSAVYWRRKTFYSGGGARILAQEIFCVPTFKGAQSCISNKYISAQLCAPLKVFVWRYLRDAKFSRRHLVHKFTVTISKQEN